MLLRASGGGNDSALACMEVMETSARNRVRHNHARKRVSVALAQQLHARASSKQWACVAAQLALQQMQRFFRSHSLDVLGRAVTPTTAHSSTSAAALHTERGMVDPRVALEHGKRGPHKGTLTSNRHRVPLRTSERSRECARYKSLAMASSSPERSGGKSDDEGGDETNLLIVVNVHGHNFTIPCGQGEQSIRWLAG